MKPKPLPHVGPFTRPYWEAARAGKFMIQRCRRCGQAIHYPRPWCPHCWNTELDWFAACGRAEVVTYTVVHQPPSEAFASQVPYVLAVARLEEGPHMMANVVDIDPARMRVGLPVRIVFEERSGGFCVPQFTPAEDPP